MKSTKSKWLAYTVLVGLMPLLSRLLVWVTAKADTIPPVSAADLVAFGLVLHISNVNELEHVSAVDKAWKTVQNGLSVIFIALYSVLYAVLLIGEKNAGLIDARAMLYCVAVLAAVSLTLSLSVLHRISAPQKRGP